MGDGSGSNIFISFHTNVFSPRKAEYGKSLEHAALFLSTDFGMVIPKIFERKYSLCGESKELASIPDAATGLLGHLNQDFLLGVGFHS